MIYRKDNFKKPYAATPIMGSVGKMFRADLDVISPPSRAETLSTMSDEKRQEMERLYGGRVRGPVQPRKLQGQRLITAPVGRK